MATCKTGEDGRFGSSEEEYLDRLFNPDFQREQDEQWRRGHNERDTLTPKYQQALSGEETEDTGGEGAFGSG